MAQSNLPASMTTNKIGGSEFETSHVAVYIFGLVLGTLIRVAAFLVPTGVVRLLEATLLPDDSDTSDIQQSH